MRPRLYPTVRYVAPVWAAACVLLAACDRRPEGANPERPRAITGGGLRGTALEAPLAKPSFVLTRADGRPYDFAHETSGKVALLFFGYTHCPDV
ncbi:MAG: SCO family protein, partial [Gemmatimonadaceae bacterium]